MTAFGGYDESYPPEILRGYVAPVLAGGAAPRRTVAAAPEEEIETVEPTPPPSNPDASSNVPDDLEVSPVEATRTDPGGPVVVAQPAASTAAAADEEAAAEVVGMDLVVTPGEPGAYEPEVAASDRPRNVTELRARARVTDPAPWPRDTYVLIGTSGKRAHWDGDDWHSGESPGYPAPTGAAPGQEPRRPVAEADEDDDESDDEQ